MEKLLLISAFLILLSPKAVAQEPRFDVKKDLLLAQFDCKTDIDDLHSAAALSTLLKHPDYQQINYHAVAGTYGIQEGLYVPPNALFEMAFGNNWSDAHADWDLALDEVAAKAEQTLTAGGNIWIADAGQSDFSADLIKLLQKQHDGKDLTDRIHVVQHSDWNEEVTSPEALHFVKTNATYHKIPDGNGVGNGTPGFRTPEFTNWKMHIDDPHLTSVWQKAIDIGQAYNGKEGRYLNEAVEAGGLDFSDLSEICWMLGLEDIKDTGEFFSRFGI